MAKQTVSVQKRNYLLQPRHAHEFDSELRNDVSFVDPDTGELEVSLTKQADANACDINNIMARYEKTGQLPDMIQQQPTYGDFSDAKDFMAANNLVIKANEQFQALDGKVRAVFDNDPAKMLEFVASAGKDPEKKKQLIDLGLAVGSNKPIYNIEDLSKDLQAALKENSPKKAD